MDVEQQSDCSVLILAVDIERINNEVIAIGGCVMDAGNGNILERFYEKSFFPMMAAGLDYHEFWRSKKELLDRLKTMVYDGSLPFEARQHQMFVEFQDFRKRWEVHAEKFDQRLIFAVDSSTDLTFLSIGIMKHIDRDAYLPYSAKTVEVDGVVVDNFKPTHRLMRNFNSNQTVLTSSAQQMLLLQVAPEKAFSWDKTSLIRKLYGIPAPNVQHDHTPLNDAITIAWEYKNLLDIASGKYSLVDHSTSS